MKTKSKVFLIVLSIIIVLGLAGSGFIYYSTENSLQNENDFYFFETAESTSNKGLSQEEILSYQPKYAEYASDTYYSTLSDSEKLIYKTVVYAFENNQQIFFVPENYIPQGKFTMEDILYFVALDSPLVEQNIASGQQTQTSEISKKDILGFTHKKEISGNYFYITTFTPEKLKYKLEAIEEAKKIVSAVPSNITTDRDKAKYFYDYIADNFEYIDVDFNHLETVNFLYDTLIKKGSNCDGFANTYSLLCNISGIKCFEKMSPCDVNSGISNTENEGHTWDCIEIDGKFYNVDATAAKKEEKTEKIWQYDDINFCVPDNYYIYDYEYRGIIPGCTDPSLSVIDCSFSDEDDSTIVKTINSEFKKNSSKYVVAHFDGISDARAEKIVNKFFYQNNFDISYYLDEPEEDGLDHYLVILRD